MSISTGCLFCARVATWLHDGVGDDDVEAGGANGDGNGGGGGDGGDGGGDGGANDDARARGARRARFGVLLKVAYDGTAFSGWAPQKQGRTVHDTLTGAIAALDPRASPPRGTSRTDAGV